MAGELHNELMNRSSQSYIPATYLALTADAAGNRQEALSFARRAWHEREPTLILHARHFTEFRRLRLDPQFGALLREMDASEDDDRTRL